MEYLISQYKKNIKAAEFYRLGVAAFVLLVQTCILIPSTALMLSESPLFMIGVSISAILSFALLVTVIAGMRVQVTLSLFLLSIAAHIVMIGIF